MAKTANIKVRVTPEVKTEAERLFARFGITMTDAINIFLHQSLMVGGLPFDVKQPGYNAETEAAIQEARDISGGEIPAKELKKLRLTWAGALREHRDQFTSLELQNKALDWWGD